MLWWRMIYIQMTALWYDSHQTFMLNLLTTTAMFLLFETTKKYWNDMQLVLTCNAVSIITK